MRRLILLLAVLLPVIAIAQPTWEHRFIGGGISQPMEVAAADFDNDGDFDVVAGSDDRTIVWENTNDGQFWIEHEINQGFHSSTVAVGDLDGDGYMDIVATIVNNGIRYWKNVNGDFSFSMYYLPNASHASNVEIADMDSDGDMDLITNNAEGDWKLHWHENTDGSGLQYARHPIYTGPDAAITFVVTDLDSDGNQDVVFGYYEYNISDYFGYVHWMKNVDGTGLTWTEFSIDESYPPDVLAVGDFDRDGFPDVAAGGKGDGSFDRIDGWKNVHGTGMDMEPFVVNADLLEANAISLAAADMDADLDVDLVAMQYEGGGPYRIVYYQNIDSFGNEWTQQIVENMSARQTIAVNIDTDNDLDIVAAAHDTGIPGQDHIHLWEQQNNQYVEIQVMSPNGGEVWHVDTPHNIYWNSTNPENVRIELFYANQLMGAIAESTENDGVYTWQVPQGIMTGNQFSIRLQIVGSPEQDFSDEPFSITSLPSFTLEPFQPSTIIPAVGGGYWYWVHIVNPTGYPISGQLWAEVILPNGNVYGPVYANNVAIGPYGTYEPVNPLGQFVPGYAPPGIYTHVMHIGIYPNLTIDTNSFTFEKLAGTSSPTRPESQWSVSDWAMNGTPPVIVDDSQQTGQALPSEFALLQPHPNPFNPTTSFSVQLPETANLQITVHDITGRLVATLANETRSAGTYTFTIDGSGLASGVYFVRAASGTQSASQKLVLMK